MQEGGDYVEHFDVQVVLLFLWCAGNVGVQKKKRGRWWTPGGGTVILVASLLVEKEEEVGRPS